MYYLRSKQSGWVDTIQDNRDDRAVFKDCERHRYCRAEFKNLKTHPMRFTLYTCKSLKQILCIRELCFKNWNEWFDVYDEQGKIDLDSPPKNREQTITLPCHIGDTVYCITDKVSESSICEYKVVGGSPDVLFVTDQTGNLCTFSRTQIGTKLFFTREEAKDGLSSRK